MRVFITGVCGFVGRHLATELAAHGHEPVGLRLPAETAPDGVPCATGDITDPASIRSALAAMAPDACVHLAGVSTVPRAWADPAAAFEVNAAATVRLLAAVREQPQPVRVLFVSSAQVYGENPGPGLLDERAPLRPSNPYGVAKAAADEMTLLWAAREGRPWMTARPVNHIGPRQSRDFVIPSFAQQLVAIARGQAPARVRIGNLESLRDFMDVRDTVRGYRLLLERGQGGEAYNLATGRMETIGRMLDLLCELAGVKPERVADRALYRPTDASPRLDTRKMREHCNWTAELSLEDSIRAIYDDIAFR